MNNSFQKRMQSFAYAFRGIYITMRSQANLQIQFLCAVIAIVLGLVLNISLTEWALIILSIGMVLASEVLNTSLEYLTDIISPGPDRKAGIIKDISAGAVLLSSITALAVGLIVFLPKLF